jgi:hypothetical protein
VGPAAGALAAAVILFLGQAWEVLFLTVGIGYVASLAAGVGMLLLLDRRTRWADVAAAVLLAVSIASSSLGLPLALGALVELLAGRERRRLLVVLVPLALYGLWFAVYREDPTRGVDLAEAPAFLADVAASAMGGLTGVAVVSDHLDGALHWLVAVEHVLAIVALAGLVWLLRTRGVWPRVLMLLTTLAGFWLVLALLRAGGDESFGGAVDPYSGRYVYPGVVLIVLLCVELAKGLAVGGRALRVMALAVAAVCAANMVWLVVSANDLRRQAADTRAELAAVEIMAGEVSPTYTPSGESRSGNAQAGPYLRAVSRIGSSPAYDPAELARAPEHARRAADRTLIRVQEIRWLGPAPRRGRRCRRVGEAAEVVLPRSGVYLAEPPARPVEVRFRRFARGYGAVAGTVDAAARIRPSLGSLEALPWRARLSSAAGFTVCGW